MTLISLVTPHADRPDAVQLCERYVRRFRVPQGHRLEWVLVDGGEVPERDVEADVYVRHRPSVHPAQNLCANFLTAIKVANGNIILVIEDDDWYHPDYVCHMVGLLQDSQMAGLKHSHYYHLPSRQYSSFGNTKHSSLCTTGFQEEIVEGMIPRVEKMLKHRHKYIDLNLWRGYEVSKQLSDRRDLSLGIKGMPGKKGLCSGHDPKGRAWNPDPSGKWLRSMVGKVDAERYFLVQESCKHRPENVALVGEWFVGLKT